MQTHFAEDTLLLQTGSPGKGVSGSINGKPYDISVNLQGVRDTLCLHLTVVSEDDPNVQSQKFDLKDSKRSDHRRDDPTSAGIQFQKSIKLPDGFHPGILTKGYMIQAAKYFCNLTFSQVNHSSPSYLCTIPTIILYKRYQSVNSVKM